MSSEAASFSLRIRWRTRLGGASAAALALCTGLGGLSPQALAQTAHAGGQVAVVTGLNSPYGVAVDASGNLYVADTYNGQVLKATLSAGAYTMSTVATGFSTPYGVAVDGGGNVYVADISNQRVVKETLSAGSYTPTTVADGSTPVAGSSTVGVNNPNAVAVDSSGNIYIADSSNNRVLKGTLSGGSYTYTVVDAALNQPKGVAVDASGAVYVADTVNQRVVKETLTAGTYVQSLIATSTAGTSGPYPYDYPFGVALDRSGNVYYSSYNTTTSTSQILRVLTSSGSYMSSVVWSGTDQPFGLATDAAGNVYFTDTATGSVNVVQPSSIAFPSTPVGTASATQTVSFTYDSGGALGTYAVLTRGAAGLDFADAGGTCATVTPAAGAICTVNLTFTPRFSGARSGAVTLRNSSGVVIATAYLQGMGTGPQLAFPPGTQSVVATGSFSGSPINPYRVAVDGSGNVYFSDRNNNRILKYTASTGTTSLVVSGLSTPYGVAVDGSGAVYVGDTYNNQVLKETPTATGTYTQSIVMSGLYLPWGVAVDAAGNVYIADNGNSRIVKESLTSPGTYTQSVVAGGLNSPYNVGVDAGGNVYHADTYGGQVYNETPTASGGYAQSVIASGLNLPYDVAVDGAGNIFVADNGNNRIVKESPSASSYTQSVVLTGLSGPAGVAVNGAGNVYVGDTGNSRVLKLDLADPPPLAFASTAVGATSSDSPRTVTLNNIGNAALTFPAPANAGSKNPSISTGFTYGNGSTCPQLGSTSGSYTLAAGASCTEFLSFSPQTAGTFGGSSVSTDNALNVSGATQSVALSGTATAGTPMVAVASTSIAYGTASATLMATVTYGGVADTGAVTFAVDGGASVTASCTASSYTATCTAGYPSSSITGGSHTITATVQADTNYITVSGTGTLTVSKIAPTVTGGSGTIAYGTASTTLTAQVAYTGPAPPSGTLTFSVDSGSAVAAICTGTGSPRTCTATYSTATLAPGSHLITAAQAADTNYGSASNTASLSVTQATPTIMLSSGSIPYGTASTTLSATVAYTGPAAPTGTLTFTIDSGASVIATCTGSGSPRNCIANYPTAALMGGNHTILATQASDLNYTGKVGSATLSVTPVTPSLTVSSITIPYGTPATTLTAKVAYAGTAAPTGTVSFSIGNRPVILATCSGLSSPLICTASYPTPSFGGGENNIAAVAAADANYTIASSNGTLTVTPIRPTVAVTPISVVYGTASATLTATIAYTGPAAPAVVLNFAVPDLGANVTATCTGNSSPLTCTASYPLSGLPGGSHTVLAIEGGDPNYTSATGTGTLIVTPLTPAIAVAPISIAYGTATTTLSAKIAYTGPTAPSGAVSLIVDSGAPVPGSCSTTAAARACTATYPTATLTVGTHTITVSEIADANYTAATGTGTLTVAPVAPLCTLSVQGMSTALVVVAVASCTDPQGQTVTYALDWGDKTNTPAAGSRTTHTYAAAGTYTVVLTGTNTSGLTATARQQITPNQLPVCTLGSIQGTSATATSASVTVTATCTDPQGSPFTATGIAWGDGTTGQMAAPNGANTHTYVNPVSTPYTVTLTATDALGLTGTATQSVLVVAALPTTPPGGTVGVNATLAPQSASVSTVSVTFICSSVSLIVGGSTVTTLPSQYGITCSSPTLTLTPQATVPVDVDIQSTAATTTVAASHRVASWPMALCILLFPFPGFTLLTLGGLLPKDSRQRRERFQALGLLLLVCFTLTSCGGSFTPPPVVATPVGAYYITITEVIVCPSTATGCSTTPPTGFIQTSLIVPLTVGKP